MAKVAAEFKYNLRLKEVLADIRENADEVVHAWGTDAAELARRLAPKESGGYSSEIGFREERGTGGVLFTAGESDETGRGIGGHLEMGLKTTRHMKPQPHVRPAEIIARDNVREKIFRRGIVKPGTKY